MDRRLETPSSDDDALRRAATILGDGDLSLRLDDAEREYERDSAGKFASSGAASDHAAEHAELARVAAAGSTSASAKSRARRAEESAALSRVAHEHGDVVGAARHAADAERHSAAAVTHGGSSEWTMRQRMSALREVDRARAGGDAGELSRAHSDAAKAFGYRSDHLTSGASWRMIATVNPADRLRGFLGRRFGVDVDRLDEAEVVRRCQAILGHVESASAAGRLVVLALRADASDREYERDESGKFASTGAASDSAKEHAERGRAAAAGTTPAARASARKAEESAALARVAHEHGDLEGASKHASDARRHADAAVAKSGRSVNTANMGTSAGNAAVARAAADKATAGAKTSAEKLAASAMRDAAASAERRASGKATLPVQNKSMAEIVASRPAAASPSLSPTEAARTAAVHDRMKLSRDQVGPPTRTPAATTTPMPVGGRAADNVAKISNVERARAASDQLRKKASVATDTATDASNQAHASRSAADHVAAAKAHEEAGRANLAAGNARSAESHAAKAADHLARSGPQPSRATPSSGGHSDDHLAGLVHEAVGKVSESNRHGEKTYIAAVHDKLVEGGHADKFGGTLNSFKNKLNDLSQKGKVELSRADLAIPHQAEVRERSFTGFKNDHDPRGPNAAMGRNFITDPNRKNQF